MIATHKGEVPFAVYILPLITGIVWALYLPAPSPTTLFLAFGIILVTFIALNIFYSHLKIYQKRWTGGILIHALLLLSGIILVAKNDVRNKADYFAKHPADWLLVSISNEPVQKGDYLHFTAETELALRDPNRTVVSGPLILTVRADSLHHFAYGDQLLIPGKTAAIDPPFNPGEFNYKQYLAHQQIYYQEFLTAGQCRVIKTETGNPLIAASLKLRQQLVNKFKTGLHNPEAIAVASTLILGYKADLSQDVLNAYADTGTIHVLSVSGAHVAIIFVFLNFGLGFLNRYRYGRYFKTFISILMIWVYAMLTGFSPAVCRAAVMISMVITGNTFSRYINTLNILALSAFILLLYNPLLITDVGFQLSYLAVFGLVVFKPLISNWFEFKHRWANKVWYLISASIAAQLITFPLSGYYFHQFPVYFLISNLFIIIPSEIIMLVGIAYLLLPSIPLLSPLLAYALEQSIILMNKGLALIEHAPYSSFKQVWLSIPDCLLIFVAIMLFFGFVHNKKSVLLRLSLICVLLACLDVTYNKIKLFRNDSITFLNLRKHTGILLKKGDEAVLITDVKPADKTYVYSIKPCLDSNRISNLHCINPDSDVQTNWFCKRANLVQFKTSQLVLINKYSAVYPENIKADYLFITGNAKVSSADLKTYEPATIITNADNGRLDTEKLKHQAASLHLNFFSLRSNKALEVASN